MPITITRTDEPLAIGSLVTVIYGPPGSLKTTVAYTAHAPLLLDFDRGSHRAAIRGDSVQVASWEDVTSITREDLRGYRTVIVDTVGRCLDVLIADIIRRNPKQGRGGALTLNGYGELKSTFIAWLTLLRSYGLDVVLVAHSEERQQDDSVMERIEVTGGSRTEIHKVADIMGRLRVDGDTTRLVLSPSDTSYGKDPAQMGAIYLPAIPSPEATNWLGEIISYTRMVLRIRSGGDALALLAAQIERLQESPNADARERIERLQRALIKRQERQAAKAAATADTATTVAAEATRAEPPGGDMANHILEGEVMTSMLGEGAQNLADDDEGFADFDAATRRPV